MVLGNSRSVLSASGVIVGSSVVAVGSSGVVMGGSRFIRSASECFKVFLEWFWMVLHPTAPPPARLSPLTTHCCPTSQKFVHHWSKRCAAHGFTRHQSLNLKLLVDLDASVRRGDSPVHQPSVFQNLKKCTVNKNALPRLMVPKHSHDGFMKSVLTLH